MTDEKSYEETTGHLVTCLAVAGGEPDPDCCSPMTPVESNPGGPDVDTLPEWLYNRFGRPLNQGLLWDQIDEGEKSYWVHQARAVRRAVDRGGFK